ncbi:TIR domain-containing protein [Hymenobacter sp.]|uniref:TIR domain-containing protein n=1 Tax=Hymenobacter sp. TaxID=1898978 RepID=UPI00286B8B7C|nr:TIR domain-containing protein [Hymenobacter sp.]
MADKKIVFIAFAIEDEAQRNLFTGQSVHPKTPFEFIDMSVKEAYESDWKVKVQTRIRRSHGVILLVSNNSLKSDGQKWEVECAKAEKKKIIGVWCYSDDRTNPAFMNGIEITEWTWQAIANFIDTL